MADNVSSQATGKKQSQLASTWNRFRKNRMALVGLAAFLVIMFFTLGAELFVNNADITKQDSSVRLQGRHVFDLPRQAGGG